MNALSPRQVNRDLAGWEQIPKPIKSLPGQLELFGNADDGSCLSAFHGELFETGRDLPGAAERRQRIIWDIGTWG